MSRRDLGDVQRHLADEGTQTNALEQTKDNHHGNVLAARGDAGADRGDDRAPEDCLFAAEPVSQPALEDGPKGTAKGKEAVDGANDAGRVGGGC